MFASRFRENAARALLLPRRRPGQRTPLWQQRQRSAGLLQVVSRHPSFPILVETYRECLRDVFDLDALAGIMRAVRARQIRVVEVETAQPSPVASSLLFEYIAQYMYDGDAPLAERRAQALSLDRELLAELLGSDDLRELLDADAIDATELELQRLARVAAPARRRRRARRAAAGRRPDARGGGCARDQRRVARRARCRAARAAGAARRGGPGHRRRRRRPLPGRTRRCPPARSCRRRPPSHRRRDGRAGAPLRAHPRAVRGRRRGRCAGPCPCAGVVEILAALARDGDLIAGHFRPGGADREYCHPEVLQQLRRRSLAALRREVEAVPAATAGQVPAGVAGGRLRRARPRAAARGDHPAAGYGRAAVGARARHPAGADGIRRPPPRRADRGRRGGLAGARRAGSRRRAHRPVPPRRRAAPARLPERPAADGAARCHPGAAPRPRRRLRARPPRGVPGHPARRGRRRAVRPGVVG